MNEHMKLLGHKVKDAVTGFEGVVESICFDLYGCVQAIVRPPLDKKKPQELGDARYFDTKRLTAISSKPIMAVPSFATEHVPGGSEKSPIPIRSKR